MKTDNLALANRHFQNKAYENCGIDVDSLSEETVRAALKRLLGIASDTGAMRYISECKEVIGEYENH